MPQPWAVTLDAPQMKGGVSEEQSAELGRQTSPTDAASVQSSGCETKSDGDCFLSTAVGPRLKKED